MAAENPCLACGACCSSFRVSFYWSEAYDAPAGTVPPEMTRHVAPLLCAMVGTEKLPARCVALQGSVGIAAWCAIYERRPTVCREFEPMGPDGQVNPLCERARQICGLPPLLLPTAGCQANEKQVPDDLSPRYSRSWRARSENGARAAPRRELWGRNVGF